MKDLLDALMGRLTLFLPGRPSRKRVAEVWALLPAEEQEKLADALQQEESLALPQQEALQPAPKEWPGQKIGMQVFRDILPPFFPYLELASILHIGEHTRLGCGTFILT
ncbi:hypothetical protein CCP3SC15_1340006 [Gammaproteobacteria bacterium]